MAFNGATGNAIQDVKNFFEEISEKEKNMDYARPSDMIHDTVELLSQGYPELIGLLKELE